MVFGRKSRRPNHSTSSANPPPHSEPTATQHEGSEFTKAQLRSATRTRKIFALLSSFLLFLAVIFLILVELGNTHLRPVLRDTYFVRLDLSQIIPSSVPNAVLINSFAQSVGLHDYYQFGLWNFCEGYIGQGMVACSKPKALYWFNPVEILLSELLAGAQITLPAKVVTYLDILKIASQWMFGLFLAGLLLALILIFLSPLIVYSRRWTLPISLVTSLTALFITVATVIGTAVSIVFKVASTSVTEINLGAKVGVQMLAFMWVATICVLVAMWIQIGSCCCCASRRDIKTGKKKGRRVKETEKHAPASEHTLPREDIEMGEEKAR